MQKRRQILSLASWLWSLLFLFACSSKPENAENSLPEPWYKNSVIYNLEVSTFKDSDGDGIGDLDGLTSKLDYLDSLGVDIIWLAPIMPSPGKDDGYDVTDFYGINPKFGTEEDFEEFIAETKKRDIKVIMDLVLNHTSIEHPWFQAARADTNSKYHLWYVWSQERPRDADKGMVFPGVQKETWTMDSIAGKYYFHRFYKFQPDLNYTNPDVQRESFRLIQYWLKKGVYGYRLDAVPFIIDIPETGSENPERMIRLVSEMREQVKKVNPEAILLGEANLSPKENKDYFGEDNSGMQMMFNFYANQYLFYALASSETKQLVQALADTREKPAAAQWAFFLRNHDEIDLGRLSDKDRDLVYSKFGPDSTMQLYDRGIRRRLAPMLNNKKQLNMAYSLLFSLPGAPAIRYGEEIGMGDDLSLKERLAVRTPMQWSAKRNAGFSTSSKTFRPVIDKGKYGYKVVNVEAQEKNPQSLYNFIRKIIRLRKDCPEIGLGDYEIIDTESDHVLAIRYDYKGKSLLVVHNFSNGPQKFSLQKGLEGKRSMTDLLGDHKEARPKDLSDFHINAYGYRWYRLN